MSLRTMFFSLCLFLIAQAAIASTVTINLPTNQNNVAHIGTYRSGGQSCGLNQCTCGSYRNTDIIAADINGTITTFSSSGVTEIDVNGGIHDDTIEFINSTDGNFQVGTGACLFKITAISYVTTINGEAGDDTIIGSDNSDTIIGGTGSDTIHGRGGNDLIFGFGQGCSESICLSTCVDSGTDICDGDAGADDVFCRNTANGDADSGDFCQCETIGCTETGCESTMNCP